MVLVADTSAAHTSFDPAASVVVVAAVEDVSVAAVAALGAVDHSCGGMTSRTQDPLCWLLLGP